MFGVGPSSALLLLLLLLLSMLATGLGPRLLLGEVAAATSCGGVWARGEVVDGSACETMSVGGRQQWGAKRASSASSLQ
jgi:hypothetical protein